MSAFAKSKFSTNALIVFFLFMPLFDMFTRREDFPFAAYVMYSGVFDLSTLDYDSRTILVGVGDDGSERRLFQIGPLNETTMRNDYLTRIGHESIKDIERTMSEVLTVCSRIPGCHATGRHYKDLGKPKGMRLYLRLFPTIEALRHPDQVKHELLLEAWRDDGPTL